MQGNTLIAHPLLHDGFFNRSVILMTNHTEEASLGFVLNFKTQFKLRDVRPELAHGNFPIYEGGPVAKDQLFFIHTLGNDLSDSIKIKDGIYFGGNFYELLHLIEHKKVKSHELRLFAGYSGWASGQLQNEINNKQWLINANVDSSFLSYPPEDLWGIQLKEIKKSYAIFADFGNNPSIN